MNTKAQKTTAKKRQTAAVVKKTSNGTGRKPSASVTYEAGSFLDKRGGMVPTVRLGKRASTKAL